MLHHFPTQDESGVWHAAYKIPGTEALHSICEMLTESSAKRICKEANDEQQLKENQAIQASIHPADRKIPKGFYDDLQT